MGLRHIKILIICCTILYAVKINACPPDTMVVYEYIHVTDTVWVEPEFLPLHAIQTSFSENNTEEIKSQLELLSQRNSATLVQNDIILSNKQQNNDDMKKLTFIGLTLLTLNNAVFAKPEYTNTLGVYLKGNVASQTHWYPGISQYIDYFYNVSPSGYINEEYFTEEKYGRYATNNLLTMGFGIRYEHFLSKSFSVVSNLGYLQRGSSDGKTEIGQYAYNGTVILTEIQKKKNKFHNVSTDVSFKWRNKNNRNVNPYLYSGFRVDYTMVRRIEYKIDNMNPFPGSSFKNFNDFNYGLVYGTGVSIKQRFFIEIEANSDIGYVVNNDILSVRNTLLSINIGINLLRTSKSRNENIE